MDDSPRKAGGNLHLHVVGALESGELRERYYGSHGWGLLQGNGMIRLACILHTYLNASQVTIHPMVLKKKKKKKQFQYLSIKFPKRSRWV